MEKHIQKTLLFQFYPFLSISISFLFVLHPVRVALFYLETGRKYLTTFRFIDGIPHWGYGYSEISPKKSLRTSITVAPVTNRVGKTFFRLSPLKVRSPLGGWQKEAKNHSDTRQLGYVCSLNIKNILLCLSRKIQH